MLAACFLLVETCRLFPVATLSSANGSFRYREASRVLYSQNTLEFDHPLSLVTFTRIIPGSSLQGIRSISIDLQRNIYIYRPDNPSLCTSFHPDQWFQMWDIISAMQGLEEIRVRFQLLIDGWMGLSEMEILEPLHKVRQPLKLFEVELPSLSTETSSKSDGKESDAPFRLIKY